jgi:hypothetical protein
MRPVPFWLAWVLVGAAGAGALLLLAFWVPPEGRESSVCLLRRFAGLPCPGCGLTRAAAHLAKGELRMAVADHPLAPALALEGALAWGLWGGLLARRRPLAEVCRPGLLEAALVAHFAVFCALWLGRLATGSLPF